MPSHEVGLAILGPLRDLDEVAYLRFASVYRSFDSLADFEREIERCGPPRRPGRRGRAPADRTDGQPLLTSDRLSIPTATTRGGWPRRPRGPKMAGDGVTTSRTRAAKHRRGDGLKVERVWTTEGVHPYDEVTWERRDIVMTNWRDGSINFEQRGVEFPDSGASTRRTSSPPSTSGARSAPRSGSGRSSSSSTGWSRPTGAAGEQHGYFATPADAEIFDARADLDAAAPGVQLQLAGLVQRRHRRRRSRSAPACRTTPWSAPRRGWCLSASSSRTVASAPRCYDAHGLTRDRGGRRPTGSRDVLRLHTKAGYTLDVTAGPPSSGRAPATGTGRLGRGRHAALPVTSSSGTVRYAYGETELDLREIARGRARRLAAVGRLRRPVHRGYEPVADHRGDDRQRLTSWTGSPAPSTRCFPDAHRHERPVATQERRPRLPPYPPLRRAPAALRRQVGSADPWRRHDGAGARSSPPRCRLSPATSAASSRPRATCRPGRRSTLVAVDMISREADPGCAEPVAALRDLLPGRLQGQTPVPTGKGCWSVRIQNDGDRRPVRRRTSVSSASTRRRKLEQSFDQAGPAGQRRQAAGDRPRRAARRDGGLRHPDRERRVPLRQPPGAQLLHPRRRRLDGLDPGLVQGRGPDLQGRLRLRGQPVPDPVVAGAALLRRHRVAARSASCAAPTPAPARSSPAAPPAARPRWSSSTSTTPTSRSSSRPRRARRTRSARCATPASTWTSAARTSSASSTRTPTTRSGSPTSSCARSRTAATSPCAAGSTGEVIETVDAQKLFRKIAQAAWECADPGIQYDDTINDWHTCPETGRITASNPCSRVHAPGQLLVQPGVAEPDEVPQRRRRRSRSRSSSSRSSSSSPRWTSRSASPTSRPRRSARPPGPTGSSASATPTWARC